MNDSMTNSLTIDLEIYSITAIKGAAYRLADRCSVNIKKEGKSVIVSFVPVKGQQINDETVATFLRELNDQELRTLIRSETADIRKLIIAQAFSNTDFLGEDE